MKALLFSSLLALAVPAGAATTPAFDLKMSEFIVADFIPSMTGGVYGWSFRVSAPATVTGIGWLDENQDGLATSHQIGIWESKNIAQVNLLLDSWTVPEGTQATLEGLYRRIDFDQPLVLQADLWYAVAGTSARSDGDLVFHRGADGVGTVPGDFRFSNGLPLFGVGEGFIAPNDGLLSYGLFVGPMLFVQQVPEPSTAVLVALAAILCWRRRVAARCSD